MEKTRDAVERYRETAATGLETPVTIKNEACISVRNSYSECRRCIDACPDKCLKMVNGRLIFDSDDCSRCGFCAAVCPSSVFALRGHHSSLLYDAIDEAVENSDEVKIGCRYTAMPGGGENGLIVLPCLSMLSEPFLVDAALYGAGAIRLTAPCDGCGITAGKSFIAGSVERARLLLSALGSDTSISFELSESMPAGTEAAVPIGEKYSRRDFIGGIRKAVAKEALAAKEEDKPPAVPAGYLEPVDLPMKRRRLNDIVKPLASSEYKFTEKDSPFRVVTVSENCTACMACSVSCPTGALSRREEPETVRILFSAVKCVKCYECAGICPELAISYRESFTADRVFADTMLLYEKRQIACISCEMPFMPKGGEIECRACVKFKKFQKGLLSGYGRLKHE